MFGTENHMQVVSQILATLLKRLRSHRAVENNEHCAAFVEFPPPPFEFPPPPLVKIGYQRFILRSILPSQDFEEWALP